MKINLHIIREDLKEFALMGALNTSPYIRNVGFATASVGADGMNTDRVYVLDPEEFSTFLHEAPPHASIICLGQPDLSSAKAVRNLNVLWTDKTRDASQIVDRINELCFRYNEWSEDITDLFGQGAPLKKVAKRSIPLFRNPMWMWDSKLQTVFHVVPDELEEFPPEYKMHEDGSPWPIAEVNAINSEFVEGLRSETPYVLPPMFGYESLCCNLFENGKHVATLAVDGLRGDAFTTRDKVLIDYLGKQMITVLPYEVHFSKHATYLVNEHLERLLSREPVADSELSAALARMGWSVNDTFFCILAHQTRKTTYPDGLLIPLAQKVCDAFPNSIFTIRDSNILFTFDITLSDLHPDDVCGPILGHLQKEKIELKLGVSTPFTNFADIYYFNEQAHEAIHLGESFDADGQIFMFHDLLLEALIAKCLDGTIPDALMPPSLSRIIRHDKANGTDLAETLRVYLENAMSMNKTSQQLFMHRNTLLTRLKRIQDIGRFDLDDYRTRIELGMAFALMGQVSATGA